MTHDDIRARTLLDGRPVVRDGVRLDLVPSLAEEIVARASNLGLRSAPSLNQGGWRSDSLLGWTTPATRALLTTLHDLTHASDLEAWAMMNWRGSKHPRHVHRGALMAGIYYVCPGGASTPPTIFEVAGRGEVHVEPLAGRMVLFPADLYHRVPVYHGDEPRVTVAFDVRAQR
jgi:hypothetical protein